MLFLLRSQAGELASVRNFLKYFQHTISSGGGVSQTLGSQQQDVRLFFTRFNNRFHFIFMSVHDSNVLLYSCAPYTEAMICHRSIWNRSYGTCFSSLPSFEKSL